MFSIMKTTNASLWEILKSNLFNFQLKFSKTKFSLPVKKPEVLRLCPVYKIKQHESKPPKY